MPEARACELIELGPPVVLRRFPLGGDPALVLELVERRIERPFAHLENFPRNLAEPDADSPAVQRLERENLQDQEVECALNQIGRFAHRLPSVTERRLYGGSSR